MIEVFFVDSADLVSLPQVDRFLERTGVKREDLLLEDFLMLLAKENQVELGALDSKIVLDEKGRLVALDTVLGNLLAQEEEERQIFVLGNSYSSEEDLNFVNQVWKKYENEAGIESFT